MELVILQYPITNNPTYKNNQAKVDKRYSDFQARGPQGIVLHSIGVGQSSAKVIANNFNKPDLVDSVHMVLQANGVVYQLAPYNYRLLHAGGTVNNTHMGIEMTEPDCIWYEGGAQVRIKDTAKALTHVKQTYAWAVDLCATICIKYALDPLKDGVILSHSECAKRGIGNNHADPEHLWDALNTGYTMDTFRAAVAKRKSEIETGQKAENDTDVHYFTLGDLKADPNSKYYLPTIEKLLKLGYLQGKGGTGDDLILDFSEDAIRILVTLDRAGTYD